MDPIEGELHLRLTREGRAVRSVTVRSTRPFAASRVLAGKTDAETAVIVPLLFGICARAQGAAAASAVEAARGTVPAAETVAAREMSVLLETIQEYLWRILIDWPRAMGREPVAPPVARARQMVGPTLGKLAAAVQRVDGDAVSGSADVPPALGRALADVAAEYVYGGSPEAWLALMDRDALAAWGERAHTLPALLLAELRSGAAALGRSDVALMPGLRREALMASVVPGMRYVPEFERKPVWDRAPVETGALARMHAHPLVSGLRAEFGNAVPARMAARLVELAALLTRLGSEGADAGPGEAVHAFAVEEGEGLAAVQTARGLLLHLARFGDGHVERYQIVAPTEWNFHPEGALVRGLTGLDAVDDATVIRQAQLVVQALDPCVACRIEVGHA